MRFILILFNNKIVLVDVLVVWFIQTKTNENHAYFLNIYFQLMFLLEMRGDSGPGASRIIDSFTVAINSSNANSHLVLNGDLGVAMILLRYQLMCSNSTLCNPSPTITATTMSKHSKLYVYTVHVFQI